MKSSSSARKTSKLKRTFIVSTSILITILTIFTLSLIYIYAKPLEKTDIEISNNESICIKGLFPFPNLYDTKHSDLFDISFSDRTHLFNNYPVLSKSLCIAPTDLLEEHSNYNVQLSVFSSPLTQKIIEVNSKQYANIIQQEQKKEINRLETLTFKLTKSDTIFDYYIIANESSIKCTKLESLLDCPLEKLSLEQSKEYTIYIVSSYNGQYIETLTSSAVHVLNAVELISSNFEDKDILIDHSPSFNFKFSKEIQDIGDILIKQKVSDKYKIINFDEYHIKTSSTGKEISIDIPKQLPKDSQFILIIDEVNATDTSSLDKPIELVFYTSNGPTIYSTNLSSTAYPVGNNIILYWDEVLNTTQDVSKLITIFPSINFITSTAGSTTTINPTGSLTSCTTYSLSVSKGATSNRGIISEDHYSTSFKTSCAKVALIGTSVQGKRIYSYTFGEGSETILFYGAMHGSESNTQTLLYAWIAELDKNYTKIPSDKKVVVVPALNPDGVSLKTRFNANEVDLNRNFNTSDWQAKTYFANKTFSQGGGDSPFSEPESKAIANYITAHNPYLTLSYHSAAAYVIPNQIPSAVNYASVYAKMSGYQYISPSTNNAFEYSITGSFGRWSSENGKAALVIELASGYSSETGRNFPAMWEMLK